MRALAITYAEEQYRAWGDLLHSAQTGETAFEKQFGTSYFAYPAQHPEADRVFNEAMTGYTIQLVGAVVDAYGFSPFKTILDVGGSYGTLLAAILRSHPVARMNTYSPPKSMQISSSSGPACSKIPYGRVQRFRSTALWCRLRATKTLIL
jgi:hypothetical protein